jgi:hypothetical protein
VVAQGLDITAHAIKRLLNHANGADVTAGIKQSAEIIIFKQRRG